MKRFICAIFLLAGSFGAFSQKVYFIYIQSETGQPFFVKMNEKTSSSAAPGYLILSNLKDSSYSIKVGFPQNKWPEQQFLVDIKAADHGFLLKNFEEKGWGLFDLQTLAIKMPDKLARENANKEFREVSAFTNILSKAANDPSLREKPVFDAAKEKEEEKVVNVAPAVIKEEAVVSKDQPQAGNTNIVESISKKEEPPVTIKEEVQKSEAAPAPAVIEEKIRVAPQEYEKSVVKKKSESSTTEGFGLVFIDEYPDGQKDTINIIIPNSAALFNKGNEVPAEEKKFFDIADTVRDAQSARAKSIARNKCSSLASENDFFQLRKKMAAQKADEAMINEAKKGFKTKCFTNEQVKNLGNLFLNEAGKFQFFEAAYPHSSDPGNFSILQTEFKDAYFIHRFKNLVN